MSVITSGPPGHGFRLEIIDFIKDSKLFSLYIQALQAMAEADPKDPLSFFQLAGLHAAPYEGWTGEPNSVAVQDRGGYCTHSTVLFPTWHRPYMAIFEQTMHAHAQRIAATYTVDRDAWIKVASGIRLPYWDWANKIEPPGEFFSSTVPVIGPDGKLRTVDNPLHSYTFQDPDILTSFRSPFNKWKSTLRRPPQPPADPVSNVDAVLKSLQAIREALNTTTYRMLTQAKDWGTFSANRTNGIRNVNSIEAIHDTVHIRIGGFGHMFTTSMAAFDPIFFLLHANLDRMLSLWSAVHPGEWVTPGNSGRGTRMLKRDTDVDANTPLFPFRDHDGNFWTSNTVQDISRFGYSYPEFQGLDTSDKETVRDAIAREVNRLYGPHRQSTTDSAFFDWTACIRVKKFELGCSFSVLLFLGDPPENPVDWPLAANLIGEHDTLVNSSAEQCANCREQSDLVVEGFVHLNEFIAENVQTESFDPAEVIPFLKENLKYRVEKIDTPVELDYLEIDILQTSVTQQRGAIFPEYDEPYVAFAL